MSNPFPSGLLQPVGNALGALTGVGGEINFIDQDKKAPYVHMYSVDLDARAAGQHRRSASSTPARRAAISALAARNDGIININQVPYSNLALGAALNEQVPNPFFGLPAGQGFNVTSATVPRRQLLRPFPQFGDILMRQATLGENQYHAAIFKFEKRVSNGWGGRINYTYSRLEDNQFGEGNFFSRNSTEAQDAYNLDAEYSDRPPRRAAQDRHLADLRAAVRRGQALGDERRRRGDPRRLDRLLDHRDRERLPDVAERELERPQRRSAAACSASTSARATSRPTAPLDRIAPPQARMPDGDCGIGLWLNTGVAVDPTGFVLGTAPRNLDDVRTPHRNNWDFVAAKDVRLGGTMRGEIRLEVLNLTNTVKVRGPITTVGSSTFGQIRVQSGFMRLTQLMFRVTF